jgi:hypothetical protein
LSNKTHLVIPDPHAHPNHENDRADWLGKFILDVKPDVVINIGDMFDMPSMNGYESGKKTWGQSYYADLESGREFDERLWAPIRKAKKRRPYSIFFEGNHENRLKKALNLQPELEGTIGFKDFELDRNYNEVVEYDADTPGILAVDGIHYAHYFISGIMGRPLGGEHPAYTMVTKLGSSATCGHSHTRDFCMRNDISGSRRLGLVAGCYQDYDSEWAGIRNKLWWRGVVLKKNVEDGNYDHEWISLERLRKEYE